MKKIFALLVITIFTLVLTGCGQDKFFDGTFTASGDKRDFGYEEADVVFRNNKIISITLRRMNPDGTEVDYSVWTGEGQPARPNLKQFRIDLANAMMKENNPVNVDTITGATDSSKGWIQAVERAIEKARK